MKISCGTDIIEIDRVKKSIENLGEKFLNTIYTKKEIEYCESHKMQKYQHYAARFASKEAVFKALSKTIIANIAWTDIEIVNDEKGRPEVILYIKIESLDSIDISISHCKEYTVATVVATYK